MFKKTLFLFCLLLSAAPYASATAPSPLEATEAFCHAVRALDLAAVQQAVTDGADINSVVDGGKTALIHLFDPFAENPAHARPDERRALAAYLVAQGIELPTEPFLGATLLHLVVRSGDVDSLNLLLPKCTREQINATDIFSLTPLHVAAGDGHAGMLEPLINAGANPDAEMKESKKTPLHLAAAAGRADCVAEFCRLPGLANPVTSKGETPLILAAKRNHAACVEQLLALDGISFGVKDASNKTALDYMIENGNAPLMEKFFESHHNKATVSNRCSDGPTHMECAIKNNHFDCFKLLLARSFSAVTYTNFNSHLYDKVREAVCTADDPRYAAALMDIQQIDPKGDPCGMQIEGEVWHILATNPDVKPAVMDYFITKLDEQMPKDTPTWKTSLLRGAVARGDHDGIRRLINMGANPQGKNKLNQNFLHLSAMKSGTSETIRILSEAGVDVNAIDSKGYTPALYAAEEGNAAILQEFIINGASVEQQTPDGKTVLEKLFESRVISNDDAELAACVETYAQKSADPDAARQQAVKLACASGHVKIASDLLKKGVAVDTAQLTFPDESTKKIFEQEQERIKKEAEVSTLRERLDALDARVQEAKTNLGTLATEHTALQKSSKKIDDLKNTLDAAKKDRDAIGEHLIALNTKLDQAGKQLEKTDPKNITPHQTGSSQQAGVQPQKNAADRWLGKGFVAGGLLGSSAILWKAFKTAQELVDQKIMRTNEVRAQAGQEPITLEGSAYTKAVLQKALLLLARKDRAKAIALLASLAAFGTGIWFEAAQQ